jgi:hypothetical protein
MLFDLRGRGRRSIVRVVYASLAVLFGSGLVLFGVGGFGGTGILTGLTKEGGGSGGGSGFAAQVSKYRKLTAKEPSNVSAWENLTKALYHEAGTEPYTLTNGEVTSKGKELFKQVSGAWGSYMALNPPKPDLELAKEMVSVYGVGGLEEASKAVEALQIVVSAEPKSATWYAQLAEYAYKAHNTRQGDLASEKAVALAPASERARLKDELAEVKANPSGEKTYTATTNGKTYTGKLNSKHEVNAEEVKTSSTSTSTSKKK